MSLPFQCILSQIRNWEDSMRLGLLLLLTAALASTAFAQGISGSFTGSVSDSTGAVTACVLRCPDGKTSCLGACDKAPVLIVDEEVGFTGGVCLSDEAYRQVRGKMQAEFTTWREGVRAEVGNVRADVIQLRIEHDRCPHCNQRLAANGQ